MNGFRSLVGAAIAASFALFALPAAADTTTLEGGCEFRGGVDCTGSCKLGFDAACNVQLSASCTGKCDVTPPSCSASCQGSCTANCNAQPGTFTCQGQCSADCQGTCGAHCSASSSDGTTQADCNAKCEASCKATCEGKCSGTPPTATCDAKCQGSCTASCDAEGNIDCNVKCQAAGAAQCNADLTASCNTKCTSQGVVVCNGVIQDFVDDAKAAADWVAAHVTYSASSSGSCTGNTCSGEAQAQASTKCSATPGPVDGGLAFLGGAFALTGVSVARRRAKKSRAR